MGWCLDENKRFHTSPKSSILSSTSFQFYRAFWGLGSAAVVEQSRLKANMVAQGHVKCAPWGWPQNLSEHQKMGEGYFKSVCFPFHKVPTQKPSRAWETSWPPSVWPQQPRSTESPDLMAWSRIRIIVSSSATTLAILSWSKHQPEEVIQ